MTTAQVVETSVTVNNSSPIQDYVHPDDQTQPFFQKCVAWKQMQRKTEWRQLELSSDIIARQLQIPNW